LSPGDAPSGDQAQAGAASQAVPSPAAREVARMPPAERACTGAPDGLAEPAPRGPILARTSVAPLSQRAGTEQGRRQKGVQKRGIRRRPSAGVVTFGAALQAGGRPFEPGTAHHRNSLHVRTK